MNKILIFIWIVLIGSNFLGYYSDKVPYQGMCILVGIIYFMVLYRSQFYRLMRCRLYLLWLLVFMAPLVLMFVSERDFLKSDYSSLTAVLFVFITSSLLAASTKNDKVITYSALAVVLISVSINFYEFFVENNVFSTAPGRSAGFFINPNIASQSIIIFLGVFLTWNKRQISFFGSFLTLIVLGGVFVTFSRGGIISLFIVIAFLFFFNYNLNWKTVVGIFFVVVMLLLFPLKLLLNSDLSDDAYGRLSNLLEGNISDSYNEERGNIAFESYNLALKAPIFGNGVGTTNSLENGAHNTFVSVFLDFGLVGVLFYLLCIIVFVLMIYKNHGEHLFFCQAFIVWLMLFSFLTHNLLGDTATIIAFGLSVSKVSLVHTGLEHS